MPYVRPLKPLQRCTTSGCAGTWRPYRKRKTTLCKECVNRENAANDARRAKLSATMKAKHADPKWKTHRAAGAIEGARKRCSDPDYRERMRVHLARIGREFGGSEAGSPSRRRAGRTKTERELGHIPPEYRDEYRRLQHKTHMKPHEITAAIRDMIDADTRRHQRTGAFPQLLRSKA